MKTAKKINIVISGGTTVIKKQVQSFLLNCSLPINEAALAGAITHLPSKEISRPDVFILIVEAINKKSLENLNRFSKKVTKAAIIVIAGKISFPQHQKLLKTGITDSIETKLLNVALLEKTIINVLRIKSLTNELQFSNERYYLVGQATNDMVWDWDLQNNKVFRSKEAWQKITGSKTLGEHNLPDSWWNRIHPQDKENVKNIIQDILQNPEIKNFHFECKVLRDDGSPRHISEKGYAMRNEKGELIRLVGTSRDISELLELEQKLEEERKIKQDDITNAVIAAQERERENLGKELHDNINQILATAKLYIEYSMQNPAKRKEFLSSAMKLILSAVEEIRMLSKSLLPPSLGEVGLKMALQELVENIAIVNKFQIKENYVFNDSSLKDEDLKLTIFRIVQEQLTNILRYAKPRHVLIEIIQKKKSLVLIITDDGKGFEKSKIKYGLGFKNIASRVQLHNGQLKIDATKGKGCTIKVDFEL